MVFWYIFSHHRTFWVKFFLISFYLAARSHFSHDSDAKQRCAFLSVHLHTRLIVLFDAHRGKKFLWNFSNIFLTAAECDIVWKCAYEKIRLCVWMLNNRERIFAPKVNCEVQVVQFSRTLAARSVIWLLLLDELTSANYREMKNQLNRHPAWG